MSSRSKILAQVKANQPATVALPDLELPAHAAQWDALQKFVETLSGIGGRVIRILPGEDATATILQAFDANSNILNVSATVQGFQALPDAAFEEPALLQNVDIALMDAAFGVAENGAVWVTEAQYKLRALPFICQHLAVLLPLQELLPNMHSAYQKVQAMGQYDFGVFIAGPSKTADIEQSLVLGAHGPKTMTVFLLP